MNKLINWFYDLLYGLQKSICYIIDFIREIFLKLAGIETVVVDGSEQDLLTHFLTSSDVKNAFWGVFLVSIILLFIFVAIAIIKSEMSEGQQKRTKAQIITKALTSFMLFLLVPTILIMGITLTNVVMSGINASMTGAMVTGTTTSSIGGQVLVTTGQDAFIGNATERELIENMFKSGQLDYNKISVVKEYYNLADINYFVGILSSIVILVMFSLSSISFVQRLFDIIMLFIISPTLVSTIPLDDGQRFKLWREMVVSKVLGCYGIILAMNLFFLIIPQIGNITFFDNNFKNGIVQLLFIIGGSFALTKANMVISQLTGNNAGNQEAQQLLSNIQTGMHMIGGVAGIAGTAAGFLFGGSDFLSNKKKGVGFLDNVSSAIRSNRNRRTITANNTSSKKGTTLGNVAKGALRFGTLPIGVMKDIVQGGLVTAGKNFVPRIKNVISGDGIINHADIIKPIEPPSEDSTK